MGARVLLDDGERDEQLALREIGDAPRRAGELHGYYCP
jgi:hypothetical protein